MLTTETKKKISEMANLLKRKDNTLQLCHHVSQEYSNYCQKTVLPNFVAGSLSQLALGLINSSIQCTHLLLYS